MRNVLLTLLLTLSINSAHAETITIGKIAPFGENSGVSKNVQSECKLETRIPEYIVKATKKDASIVITSESLDKVDGPVMFVTIAYVHAPGGGNWSGGKRIRVDLELKEDGEILDATSLQRSSRTGLGTCAILKKITRVLGEDIVAWLQQARQRPSTDSS